MNCSFNNRATLFSVAGRQGVQVYSLPNAAEGFRRVFSSTVLGGASIVTVLDETPLLAIVGCGGSEEGTDRFLQLYDTARSEVITSLYFDSVILGVRMNAKRLVVLRERQTHIFDLNTMRSMSQIGTQSPVNRKGLGALSPLTDSGCCYFCYSFSNRPPNSDGEYPGGVLVLEAVKHEEVTQFQAHEHPLAAIECDGSRIVTASASGTIIRVFTCPGGQLLHELRRGQRKAAITSLCLRGGFVAVCSDAGTLHIFACDGSENDRLGSIVRRETRSFAKIQLRSDAHTICAIAEGAACLSVATIPKDHSRPFIQLYNFDARVLKAQGEFPFQPNP